jgi:hypothetical protein
LKRTFWVRVRGRGRGRVRVRARARVRVRVQVKVRVRVAPSLGRRWHTGRWRRGRRRLVGRNGDSRGRTCSGAVRGGSGQRAKAAAQPQPPRAARVVPRVVEPAARTQDAYGDSLGHIR